MKLKKPDQQQFWAEALRHCRLPEAVRMAKELGLRLRSLIKNIPSPRQQWTAPVEDWARDIYEKLAGACRRAGRAAGGICPSPTSWYDERHWQRGGIDEGDAPRWPRSGRVGRHGTGSRRR